MILADILLNDRPFKPEDEFSFPVGEVVNVNIIIFNYSGITLMKNLRY